MKTTQSFQYKNPLHRIDKMTIRAYHGSSMKGTFKTGDFLRVQQVAFDKIRPGDIVAYHQGKNESKMREIAHRVIQIVPSGLITRGDSNTHTDISIVRAERYLGKVTHVERNGQIRRVNGGILGLIQSKILYFQCHMGRLFFFVFGWLYSLVRISGVVRYLWKPSIKKVQIKTTSGPLIKFICGKNIIAYWWPEQDRWKCNKPYDLVLRRKDLPERFEYQ